MPAIDFPASPSEGDALIAGSNIWQYDGSQWVIVALSPESVPNYGEVSGGRASGVGNILFIDGGSAASTYGSASSIDAGTA
jgi:hypothetical protein